ncbi:AzlD domain-containing protein [Tepidiforma sp.]|uniref:AzlD domain-containing protein n=1 Tax=Tepidiforma sp. TaxID=2682230 RepID=UPI002ADDCFD2|nr:AzlD domain-containing protein [Tepidiforma sp.]
MSAAWLAAVFVGLGTTAIRGAGPLLFGARQPAERTQRLLDGLGSALLAALVVTATFADAGRLALDARAAGVAAAAALLAARVPLVAAVIAAAVVTAGIRAL